MAGQRPKDLKLDTREVPPSQSSTGGGSASKWGERMVAMMKTDQEGRVKRGESPDHKRQKDIEQQLQRLPIRNGNTSPHNPGEGSSRPQGSTDNDARLSKELAKREREISMLRDEMLAKGLQKVMDRKDEEMLTQASLSQGMIDEGVSAEARLAEARKMKEGQQRRGLLLREIKTQTYEMRIEGEDIKNAIESNEAVWNALKDPSRESSSESSSEDGEDRVGTPQSAVGDIARVETLQSAVGDIARAGTPQSERGLIEAEASQREVDPLATASWRNPMDRDQYLGVPRQATRGDSTRGNSTRGNSTPGLSSYDKQEPQIFLP